MTNDNWRDYYKNGNRLPYFERKKTKWALNMIQYVSDSIPKFTDVFDEQSFYWFAFFFTIGTFLTAFFLAKVVGVKIKPKEL